MQKAEDNQQPKDRYAAQNRYFAKLRAQGLNPRLFWLRDEEHRALKARLEELRGWKS